MAYNNTYMRKEYLIGKKNQRESYIEMTKEEKEFIFARERSIRLAMENDYLTTPEEIAQYRSAIFEATMWGFKQSDIMREHLNAYYSKYHLSRRLELIF